MVCLHTRCRMTCSIYDILIYSGPLLTKNRQPLPLTTTVHKRSANKARNRCETHYQGIMLGYWTKKKKKKKKKKRMKAIPVTATRHTLNAGSVLVKYTLFGGGGGGGSTRGPRSCRSLPFRQGIDDTCFNQCAWVAGEREGGEGGGGGGSRK